MIRRTPTSQRGWALFALSISACLEPTDARLRSLEQLDYAGQVERLEGLGRYSAAEAGLLIQQAGNHQKITTDHDFALYRVIYPTVGVHGGTTRVSGLVAVPLSGPIKGVVSWQHGTNTDRANSISTPSLPEGVGVAAVFAGDGFMFVAPDYIGLGVSHEVHPYYHWPSTVSTATDLLSIAERMLTVISDEPVHDLYLSGFSQGGGASAALQRSLQAQNPTLLRLRGAATIAASFNPRDIGLPNAIERDQPFFLALLLSAFAQVYEQPLTGIVAEPYRRQLAAWFDGSHDQRFIDMQLPKHVSELLTEQFLQDFQAGNSEPAWFYAALGAAETDDYAPSAPLRIHYGSKDTIVIPKEAKVAFEQMRARDGHVELVDVGPFDHDNTVLHALPFVQQWFNELAGRTP